MKKQIISINEDLCIGCGNCVTSCHQSALQIVNGKAKLVKENFCDGLGKCIGKCPTDALSIVEKEVEVKPVSAPVSKCGCPGSMVINGPRPSASVSSSTDAMPLTQWPVQIHLVNPSAPYFQNSELTVLSTCSPIASGEVRPKFISKGAVVVGCPKLDNTEGYVEKLKDIFVEAQTPKVNVVIMSVPCCKGLSALVSEAVRASGRKDLIVEEHVVSLDGKLAEVRKLNL
ncbi:MAG: 4Fe-4S binding protein [Pseudomonadota bacterium]